MLYQIYFYDIVLLFRSMLFFLKKYSIIISKFVLNTFQKSKSNIKNSRNFELVLIIRVQLQHIKYNHYHNLAL